MPIDWTPYVFHRNVLPKVEWLSAGALVVEEYGCSWEEASRQLTANGVTDSYYHYCPQCTGPIDKSLLHRDHDCKWCGIFLPLGPKFRVEEIPLPIVFQDFDFQLLDVAKRRWTRKEFAALEDNEPIYSTSPDGDGTEYLCGQLD